MSLGDVFLSELLGTAMLTLLGCGVVANVVLGKNKGFGGGGGGAWIVITWGWAMAVFAGVYVALESGAHINPAYTVAFIAYGNDEFVPGIDVNFGNTLVYFAAEFLGAFIGAVVAWLAYRNHFDEHDDPGGKLAVFSTGPAIRNYTWNLITEIIGTFVLVFVIFQFGRSSADLGPLPVALLVLGIGLSLGGPTGYAINPARDLGPRIAHFVLPIKGKGDSDWGYSWVPVVGPIIGGLLGGLVANWYA